MFLENQRRRKIKRTLVQVMMSKRQWKIQRFKRLKDELLTVIIINLLMLQWFLNTLDFNSGLLYVQNYVLKKSVWILMSDRKVAWGWPCTYISTYCLKICHCLEHR